MKKLFWKIGYMLRMNKRTNYGFIFGWNCACIFIDEHGDEWTYSTGKDMADEEMSCWDD